MVNKSNWRSSLKIKGDGITLTNDEIKDIMKATKHLENKGTLLKGTTSKISSEEEEFLSFFKPLIKVDLPLMKNVLTTLAESVLIPLVLIAAATATDAGIQRKIIEWGTTVLKLFQIKKRKIQWK